MEKTKSNLVKCLIAFCICLIPFALFAGCGEVTPTSMTLKADTLETTLVRGESLDTSNVVVVVTYSDNTTKEIQASELQFSTVDTSTTGTKTLTITYAYDEENSITCDVDITVVATEADVMSISRLQSQLIVDYNGNRTATGQNDSFIDQNQPLYVGDDNAFDFRINAAGYDRDGQVVTNIVNPRTTITVEIIGDNPLTTEVEADTTYTVLNGTDLEHFVTINAETSTLDFTEDAIGHQFRVTVEATNKDETAEESATRFTAVLSVIDAYNVYTATDLMMYDNYYTEYDMLRAQLGLPDSDTINGLVLQADIVVTSSDVRQGLFWSESDAEYNTIYNNSNDYVRANLLGSPKDSSSDETGSVYRRNVANGQTFNFIGNYFSIDMSQFPLMVVESLGGGEYNYVNSETDQSGNFTNQSYMTGHTCVFATYRADNITENTEVNWQNLNFIGNAELSNDPKNSGGILLMKNNRINFTAYNTLMNNFYIGYFLLMGDADNDLDGEYVIDSCKGYNSYQCLFYAWGAEHLVIKNSEFKQAGGPAIITDHSHIDEDAPEPANTGNPSHVDIINSDIESIVTAQSPWFTIYGATPIMQQIPLIDQMLDGSKGLPDTNKTIIESIESIDNEQYQRMNIIAVAKSGGSNIDVSAGGYDIRGYVRIFDTQDDYDRYYGYGEYVGQADPTTTYGIDMYSDVYQSALKNRVHYVQDSATGAYLNENITENKDGNMFKLSIAAQVFNGVIDAASSQFGDYADMLNTLKIDLAEFSQMTNAEKINTLQTPLSTIASFASMAGEEVVLQLVNGYYNALLTQGQIFGAIDGWDSLTTVADKVAALNAEIATFLDMPTGQYLNLYTYLGITAIIEMYPVSE